MPRPNIIYLHSHDTGRYIQPYGYDVPTPNMQRLAEEGVLFRQAFCAAPTCSPSRAALLTGQYTHSAGLFGLVNRGWTLPDGSRHIVQTLNQNGYHTALFGVTHVLRDRNAIGYKEIPKVANSQAANVAEAFTEWVRQSPPQPFFAAVGFSETHRDFPEPGPGDDPRYCRPPAPFPDHPDTRHDMAAFRTCARRLDAGIGAVLQALEDAGLADNTLVINTTDHGIAFPGMKCNLTNHGMGVLLIMRGPGGFQGGRVVDALVSHIDLFPTICDVAGIDHPDWLQGVSLMPLISGEADEVREEVHAEVNYHASYEPMRAVRTKRWNYIRRFDGRDRPVLPNCDDSITKAFWLDHGWANRRVDEEQLYDLIFDPHETNNLAACPEHADVLEDMRARLERWMRDTNDPLPDHPIPVDDQSVVNPVDATSPREPSVPQTEPVPLPATDV